LVSRQIRDQITSIPSSSRAVLDRIRHFECFSLVRIVSEELATQDDPNVAGSMTKHCQKLGDLQKDVCNDIISKKLPDIRVLLRQKKRPDQVCDAIGYNRSFSSGHTVSKRFCGIIVDKLRTAVHDSSFKPWRNRLRNRSHIPTQPPLADQPRPQLLEFGTSRRLLNRQSDSTQSTDNLPHRTSGSVQGRSEFGLSRVRKRSAVGSFRHFFSTGFFGRAVCQAETLTPEERMSCHTITRFVIRGLHEELVTGVNSTYICEQLEERHLVTFSEASKSDNEDGDTKDGSGGRRTKKEARGRRGSDSEKAGE
jgi:hypothetical protein